MTAFLVVQFEHMPVEWNSSIFHNSPSGRRRDIIELNVLKVTQKCQKLFESPASPR